MSDVFFCYAALHSRTRENHFIVSRDEKLSLISLMLKQVDELSKQLLNLRKTELHRLCVRTVFVMFPFNRVRTLRCVVM